MIYWVENAVDGSFVSGASTYEQALKIQHDRYKKGIDTYIRKE